MRVENYTFTYVKGMNEIKIGLFIFVELSCYQQLDAQASDSRFSHCPYKKVQSLVCPDKTEEKEYTCQQDTA